MNNILAENFKDTKRLYETNPELVKACDYSKSKHCFYKADDKITACKNRFQTDAEIIVSRKRSFEAAEQYAKSGKKVGVLNFANSFNPGGGVLHGARAQEECLCRISTLYDSLSSTEMMSKFYLPHRKTFDDLATDDVIYTPEVTVFKSDVNEPVLLPEKDWYKVDVLTCAAPCIGRESPSVSMDELEKLHWSRANRILEIAGSQEIDVLILGAFGCGAFSNPPEIVAKVYKEIIADYSKAFKTIEFAIYCSAYETENFDVFSEISREINRNFSLFYLKK